MGIVKKVHFDEEGRAKLKEGISQMTRSVGSTMGPMGRTVLIESERHLGGITATKDGVTVAEGIGSLYDPVENLAIMMMREAAKKTATAAGDGTTTAIVLAGAMITEAEDQIDSLTNNRVEVTRYMSKIAEDVASKLEEASTVVEGKTLYQVATVSANNDEELGKLIGDAYSEVGKSGIVTVAESKTSKTYSTLSKGIQFKRGITSRHQMTNHQKGIAELKDVAILVTDLEIPSFKAIVGIVERVMKENKSLLIIGQVTQDFDMTFNSNVDRKTFKGAQVLPPHFGSKREEMMEDIASAVGARYISEKTGSDWGLVTYDDLGFCDNVIVDKENTSIMQSTDTVNDTTKKRIDDINKSLKEDSSEESQEFLKERLAMLSGRVATIHVGAKTTIEQKEKKDRVDDAVLATRAALEMGILPGGGIALMDTVHKLGVDDNVDFLTAQSIMDKALTYPFSQILLNAGKDPDKFLEAGEMVDGVGYNPKTGVVGNMMEMGIIDPTKVTISALLNSTSVATTILMTSAIITNVREIEK